MWGMCAECGKDNYLRQGLCHSCGVELGYITDGEA
jgi:NMD protein affecting ribosome stability and mRNA decay